MGRVGLATMLESRRSYLGASALLLVLVLSQGSSQARELSRTPLHLSRGVLNPSPHHGPSSPPPWTCRDQVQVITNPGLTRNDAPAITGEAGKSVRLRLDFLNQNSQKNIKTHHTAFIEKDWLNGCSENPNHGSTNLCCPSLLEGQSYSLKITTGKRSDTGV